MSGPNNNLKPKIRIIILVFVGVSAFIVSVLSNYIGMKNVLNNQKAYSNQVGLTVRDKKKDLSNIEEDDDEKISEENIVIASTPILKLVNNRWDRVKANFSDFELDNDGNAVFDKGYVFYCNGKYVNYAIFNKDYKYDIVDGIKVGTDFKTIEKTLGKPTFKSKDYLGYKTKQVYVFFYEDEVSVYPNRGISNNTIEELFQSYLEKTYKKERTYFVADIRENYKDFIIEYDSKNDVVKLISTTRQVIATLDSIGNIEVEFYNGYNIANDITKEYIKQKRYTINSNDLIEIIENERINGK